MLNNIKQELNDPNYQERFKEIKTNINELFDEAVSNGMPMELYSYNTIASREGYILREHITVFEKPAYLDLFLPDACCYYSKSDIDKGKLIMNCLYKRDFTIKAFLRRFDSGLNTLKVSFVNYMLIKEALINCLRIEEFYTDALNNRDNLVNNTALNKCAEFIEELTNQLSLKESKFNECADAMEKFIITKPSSINFILTKASDNSSKIVNELKDWTPETRSRNIKRLNLFYATDAFDIFADNVFGRDLIDELTSNGESIFEYIFINDKPLFDRNFFNEGDYYFLSVNAKLRLVAEALRGSSIAIVLKNYNNEVMPVNFVMYNDMHGTCENISSDNELTSILTEAVEEKLNKISTRSDNDRKLLKSYIIAPHKIYPQLEYANSEDLMLNGKFFKYKSAAARKNLFIKVYTLGDLSGKLWNNKGLLPKYTEFINAGIRAFDGIMQSPYIAVSKETQTHPIYKAIMSRRSMDYIFIDGINIKDYICNLYGKNIFDNEEYKSDFNKLIKCEMISAIASGIHHVDIIKIGMDDYGRFQIGVNEIRFPLVAFDKMGFFLQKPRSEKVKNLSLDDKETRQANIRASLNDKLLIETKKLENRNIIAKKCFEDDSLNPDTSLIDTDNENDIASMTLEEKRAKVHARMRKKGLNV